MNCNLKHGTRIVIVLNPASGRGTGARIRRDIERRMTEAAQSTEQRPSGLTSTFASDLTGTSQISWVIEETACKGDGERLSAEAVNNGADIVVACGGDGTMNEVLNGVAGSNSILALIPAGTGNDFARHIGIQGDVSASIDALLNGSTTRVDVATANDRYFINVAGCGFDAEVAGRVNHGYRRLRGTPAYLAAVMQTLMNLKPTRVYLKCDSRSYEKLGLMCAVANAPMYGGGMRIAPDARIDDGLLDVCLLENCSRMEFIRAFPMVFRGAHTDHRRVTMDRARFVDVASDVPLPLLVDGELWGTTPARFSFLPGGMLLRTPRYQREAVPNSA